MVIDAPYVRGAPYFVWRVAHWMSYVPRPNKLIYNTRYIPDENNTRRATYPMKKIMAQVYNETHSNKMSGIPAILCRGAFNRSSR